MPDLEDPFVPLGKDSMFVDFFDSKDLICDFLDDLENIFKVNTEQNEAFLPALKVCGTALKNQGGKIVLFSTSLPTLGQHPLKNRLRQVAPQNILGLFLFFIFTVYFLLITFYSLFFYFLFLLFIFYFFFLSYFLLITFYSLFFLFFIFTFYFFFFFSFLFFYFLFFYLCFYLFF